MAKQTEDPTIAAIKVALKKDTAVVGTQITLKRLREGKLEKIYLTSNCPSDLVDSVNRYASMSGCAVEKLSYPNDELGALCKKPFSVSVLGLLRGG